MGLSQGSLVVVQFGASVVIARLLTPYEMGIFAIAVATVGLLSIIRALGLPAYLVRSTALTESLLSSVFTVNAIINILLASIIAGLSVLGGALLGEPGVQRSLLVMALVPLLGIFDFLPATLIERAGNFRVIALLGLVRSVVASGVAVALAFAGFSYMSLVYGQVVSAVASVIGFNILGWRDVRLRIGFQDWRNVMRYALQMVGISGVTIFATRMSDIVLGRVLGLDALGLYSRASGLSGMLWENLHLGIQRIVFVDFSNQKRDGLSLRVGYLHVLRMVTAALWPGFAGLAVLAGPVVLTLYGDTWIAAATPLSILCVATLILVAITMTWEVFNVSHETARQAKMEFIRAGVALMLFTLGCLGGLVTAALARVGESCFSVVLYRSHMERMTDTRWRDILPIYRESALLTVLAVLPAVLMMTFYRWSPAAPLPAVAASVLAGVAAWLAGAAVLRHPLSTEIGLAVSSLGLGSLLRRWRR